MKTAKTPAVQINNSDDIWLTSSNSLRKLVGILGMALPLLLILWVSLYNGMHHPIESISHYYYTRASGIFVVIMGMLAIFLIIYNGKEKIEFYLSTIAGICALLVVMFPTDSLIKVYPDKEFNYLITVIERDPFREKLHYISAAIFLGCLAYMALFVFTRSAEENPKDRTHQKRIRNRIYRTCGVLMIIALVLMFLGLLKVINPTFYFDNHMTFWMETLAVESFGISWLIKGETLFQDKKN